MAWMEVTADSAGSVTSGEVNGRCLLQRVKHVCIRSHPALPR